MNHGVFPNFIFASFQGHVGGMIALALWFSSTVVIVVKCLMVPKL